MITSYIFLMVYFIFFNNLQSYHLLSPWKRYGNNRWRTNSKKEEMLSGGTQQSLAKNTSLNARLDPELAIPTPLMKAGFGLSQ